MAASPESVATQAKEAGRVAALLDAQREKERQLAEVRVRREHDNRRRVLVRGLDLHDKHSKVGAELVLSFLRSIVG